MGRAARARGGEASGTSERTHDVAFADWASAAAGCEPGCAVSIISFQKFKKMTGEGDDDLHALGMEFMSAR